MAADFFVITGTAAYVAGATHTLTITCMLGDDSGPDITYTGSHNITFSGANIAPQGSHPNAVDSGDIERNFGIATALIFTLGVATSNVTLVKAESASISVTDGTLLTTTPFGITVTAGTYAAFKITGTASVVTGVNNAITVTAVDSQGNTDLTFNNASVSLTFSGAINSPNPTPDHPVVVNKSSLPINFGSACVMDFSGGSGGAATGNMRIYGAQTATQEIAVTDGTYSASGVQRLAVTVTAGTLTQFQVTGSPTQAAGTAQNITVTA